MSLIRVLYKEEVSGDAVSCLCNKKAPGIHRGHIKGTHTAESAGSFLSHPDYTVGSGITPDRPPWRTTAVRGLYRRSGIPPARSPCPEELLFTLAIIIVLQIIVNTQNPNPVLTEYLPQPTTQGPTAHALRPDSPGSTSGRRVKWHQAVNCCACPKRQDA